MISKNVKYETIDEYISLFSSSAQELLISVFITIKKVAPKSEEAISYGIPTLKLNGKNLVHFAGYEKHVGFYPGSKAVLKFAKEIATYKSAKGSIQFPIDKKMPLSLISKIVKFAVAENELRSKKKTTKPKNRI